MLQNESRYNVVAKTDKTTFKEVGKPQGRDGKGTNSATWLFLASWLYSYFRLREDSRLVRYLYARSKRLDG